MTEPAPEGCVDPDDRGWMEQAGEHRWCVSYSDISLYGRVVDWRGTKELRPGEGSLTVPPHSLAVGPDTRTVLYRIRLVREEDVVGVVEPARERLCHEPKP